MPKRTLCRVLAWPAMGAGPQLGRVPGLPGLRAFASIPSRAVAILARDFRFDPMQIVAAPGESLIVSIVNRGRARHSIVFDLGGRIESLGRALAPGESAEMRLVVPAWPGEYSYHCPVEAHRAMGMRGRLFAVPRGAD
jgi:plastocyanin